MKLTTTQIQFIDQYLQKSDVIFVDVRAEMIDHIATAVEQKMVSENLDFYDAFKSYMSLNKKELLKDNNALFRPLMEGVMQFSKTLYRPYNIAFLVVLVFGFLYLKPLFDEVSVLKIVHRMVFVLIMVFAITTPIISFFIFKKRYLYLEKATHALVLIYWFNLLLNGFSNLDFHGNSFSIGITVYLFFAFVIHYILTIRRLKNQYS